MRKICSLLALFVVALPAQAVMIDFNDGTDGADINGFYSGLGVTFSNAHWDGFVSTNEGSVGAGGLKLVGGGASGQSEYTPKAGSPIVATFSFGITDLSIYGLNVGELGARIDVYDAAVGGNLLDSAQVVGVGLGANNHPLLVSSASLIYRVEFYQPVAGGGEGMLWDNLSFTRVDGPVPEPATLALMGLGLAGFRLGHRKSAA